jgi:hypothetical protein
MARGTPTAPSEHLLAHLSFEEQASRALNDVSRRISPDDIDAPEPPDRVQ